MAAFSLSFSVFLIFCCFSLWCNADPDPLQDFCVSDTAASLHVNGFLCKDPATVTPDDFSSSFIAASGNVSNPLGLSVKVATAATFPGLNTFGISFARIDLAPRGTNPPHVHPRASELLYLQYGTLYVGFVSTDNKLFAKTITAGQIFIFPRGLLHFQLNTDAHYPALAISALTSQNPGTSQVARALFASTPAIDDAVLQKAFHVGHGDIEHLKQAVAKS